MSSMQTENFRIEQRPKSQKLMVGFGVRHYVLDLIVVMLEFVCYCNTVCYGSTNGKMDGSIDLQ